jgi:hypothetical protein
MAEETPAKPRGSRRGKTGTTYAGKPLSTDPKQIRNRARRRLDKFDQEVELYLQHSKPIADWDLEELARGRPRDKDGKFRGPAPKWLTPAVTREAKRRLMDHTFGSLAGHVDAAIKAVAQLLSSTETDDFGKPIVDARTKLAAAQFVIENIIGKPTAVVEIGATDTVRQFLAAALVMPDGEPAYDIEGSVVEDDDDTTD